LIPRQRGGASANFNSSILSGAESFRPLGEPLSPPRLLVTLEDEARGRRGFIPEALIGSC